MHQNHSLVRGHILDLLDFYLTLFSRTFYRVAYGQGGLAERNLSYCKSLIVDFLYFSPYSDRTATLAVVILADIQEPAVTKSGYSSNGSSRRYDMAASIISLKLWGRIFDDRPTAIPSTP